MSILNDLLNVQMMGEPQRLDYVIRQHDKLQARVDALVALLVSRGVITGRDLDRQVEAFAPPAPESRA